MIPADSDPTSAVRALVDQLAQGDRSTALALHALISVADADRRRRLRRGRRRSIATTTSPRCAPPAATPSARRGA